MNISIHHHRVPRASVRIDLGHSPCPIRSCTPPSCVYRSDDTCLGIQGAIRDAEGKRGFRTGGFRTLTPFVLRTWNLEEVMGLAVGDPVWHLLKRLSNLVSVRKVQGCDCRSGWLATALVRTGGCTAALPRSLLDVARSGHRHAWGPVPAVDGIGHPRRYRPL